MNVVILAAGMGKRMHSALPKVLHPLAGKPLLAHVVDTARALSPSRLVVIYGHGGEAVPQALQAADLAFTRQEPQLGTGHAVMQAIPYCMKADDAPTPAILDIRRRAADQRRVAATPVGQRRRR